MSTYDHLFKLLVIGDTFVGKTAITTRLNNDSYLDKYIETIGIDFKIRTICLDGFRIRLQIWDTAGIAQLNTVTPAYYSQAVGIVLVYSIIDKGTFDSLYSWLQICQEYASENVEKVIVGNKSDLEDYRQVHQAEGKQMATMYRSLFFETSAKQNYNIQQTFVTLARNILSNRNLTPITSFHIYVDNSLAIPKEWRKAAQKKLRDHDHGRKHSHHHHHHHACCYIS